MKLEAVVRRFFDFEKPVEAGAFGAGHINDTYKVRLAINGQTKTCLLQRINHQVFRQPEAVMHNIHLVAEHLASQPYPLKVLAPVPALDGHWMHRDEKGNYWRVFPFFENTLTIDKVASEEQAYEAARAFGAFAKALDSMDVAALKTTIPGFHDGLMRLGYFKQVLKRALPDRLKEARPEVDEVLKHQSIFKKVAALRLPLRATHHDTKINNVLLDANSHRAVCVIDLDTVMPGIVLSDFGDMMRTYTCAADEDEPDLSLVEMRLPIFEATLEGFLSEMHGILAPEELAHLPEGGRWLTMMQAARFLADYLEGDVYYKTKYEGHNLVRARNQLALFVSMTATLI